MAARVPSLEERADAAVIDWLRDYIADRVLWLGEQAAADPSRAGKAARATATAELCRLDRLVATYSADVPAHLPPRPPRLICDDDDDDLDPLTPEAPDAPKPPRDPA